MSFFVNASTFVVVVGLIVVSVWILHQIKVEKDPFYKFTFSVILSVMIVLIITLLVLLTLNFASAAENPAAAPAESAITVKSYTSCPTEFNPEDPGWAMHEEKRENKKIKDTIIAVTEHKRVFSYFPDPEQRIFVGIKEWKNPDCVAELFSYGSANGVVQKRILAVIRSSGKTVVFLLTEKGWERGDDWETFVDNSAGQYHLVFALYRDKVNVASRALPVEPAQRYYHFQFEEPVE